MNKSDAWTWTLTAAAMVCAVCGLLALNSLEVQALDETLSLGVRSAALQPAPKAYQAAGRCDIMLRAAGTVLN